VSTLELARLSTVLVLGGVIIGDLEMLFRRREIAPGGFFSWELLRTSRRWTVRGRVAAVADVVFPYPNVVVLIVIQLVAAMLAALAAIEVVPAHDALWIGTVLAISLLLHLRNQYGLDGSDQMRTIVLAGLVLFYVAPTDLARDVALVFIAAQAMLSYFTSGFAKLISPVWRDGTAIRDILSTRSYGSELATRVMKRLPSLSPALCWGTIGFECFLPLLVLLGTTTCIVFIGMGVAFHVGIAAMMGLNLFVWSFVATYPALYFLATVL
jgi:hypothetical protein